MAVWGGLMAVLGGLVVVWWRFGVLKWTAVTGLVKVYASNAPNSTDPI